MKLKNKKTGIIGELHFEPNKEYHFMIQTEDPADVSIYKKLADLYTDWEDALEEPERYWYIAHNGTVGCFEYDDGWQYGDFNWQERLKQIGNYFSSREEAEKAVERLRAWKRLRDKGFRFVKGYLDNNDDFIIKAKLGHVGLIDQPDVHLLFGGEE